MDHEGEHAGDDLTTRLEDELALTFQWCAAQAPAGVETDYDAASDDGDDPSLGRIRTSDPEWSAVLAELDADPEFHRRRATLDVGLHIVVREAGEATLMAWPTEDAVTDVVLTLPLDVVTSAPSRRDAYVEAVVTLVTAVGEALREDA